MKKYGKLVLLYGRLIAVVRTFIPLVAGMAEMPLGIFTVFNLLGAIIWCVTVPLLGYYLGHLIPNLTHYLIVVVVGIVVVSLLPGILEWRKKTKQCDTEGKR